MKMLNKLTPIKILLFVFISMTLFSQLSYACKLGDLVWYDANCNGIQDTTEVGIDGVKVTLWEVRPDTLLNHGSMITGYGGWYKFYLSTHEGGLYVTVDPENFEEGGALFGYKPTSQFEGIDPALDSNGFWDINHVKSDTRYIGTHGNLDKYDFTIDFGFCEDIEEECGSCEGKITELTLVYQGSEEEAQISIFQKKIDTPIYSGVHSGGDLITFTGQDKFGTMGTEITIFINDFEHTKIHTSCSQPIGPGLIKGDFLVAAGVSREGGVLCPVDVPQFTCADCEGKVSQLTLQYVGLDTIPLSIYQKKIETPVFEDTIAPYEPFTFIGLDNKGTLGTEISLFINGIEHTKIHTSCSQPIGPGLIQGDFEVISGISRIGGPLCPVELPPTGVSECDGKVTQLTLRFNGLETAHVVVTQVRGGMIFDQMVDPGNDFTFSGADKKGTMNTEITIFVNGEEHTKIHTSCSQEIGPGFIAGDFEVIEGYSRNGGLLPPITIPEENLNQTNESIGSSQNVITGKEFKLYQNSMNPFNPSTEIRFQLGEARSVSLRIFNTLGQLVRTLADGYYNSGIHTVKWDGKNEMGHDVAAGRYIYQIKAGSYMEAKSMSLIR